MVPAAVDYVGAALTEMPGVDGWQVEALLASHSRRWRIVSFVVFQCTLSQWCLLGSLLIFLVAILDLAISRVFCVRIFGGKLTILFYAAWDFTRARALEGLLSARVAPVPPYVVLVG